MWVRSVTCKCLEHEGIALVDVHLLCANNQPSDGEHCAAHGNATMRLPWLHQHHAAAPLASPTPAEQMHPDKHEAPATGSACKHAPLLLRCVSGCPLLPWHAHLLQSSSPGCTWPIPAVQQSFTAKSSRNKSSILQRSGHVAAMASACALTPKLQKAGRH